MFGWLGKLISPVIQTVSKFAKPVITKVSEFAKPLWSAAKKVGSFIPGASEAMEAIEGIGSGLLGTAEEEAGGAMEDVRDAGEAIKDMNMRNYKATRGELEDTLRGVMGRGQRMKGAISGGFKQLRDVGRKFAETARSRKGWSEMYGADDEDEEDNNYRLQRAKARAERRRKRQRAQEIDYYE